jgi:hypothetical protein
VAYKEELRFYETHHKMAKFNYVHKYSRDRFFPFLDL